MYNGKLTCVCVCMFTDYTMNFGHYSRGNNLQSVIGPHIQPQSWCTFALTQSTQCLSGCAGWISHWL